MTIRPAGWLLMVMSKKTRGLDMVMGSRVWLCWRNVCVWWRSVIVWGDEGQLLKDLGRMEGHLLSHLGEPPKPHSSCRIATIVAGRGWGMGRGLASDWPLIGAAASACPELGRAGAGQGTALGPSLEGYMEGKLMRRHVRAHVLGCTRPLPPTHHGAPSTYDS